MIKSTESAYEVAMRMLDADQLVACIPVEGGVYTFGGSTTFQPETESQSTGVALAACIKARDRAERQGLHPVD